jgi:hypothetical protein
MAKRYEKILAAISRHLQPYGVPQEVLEAAAREATYMPNKDENASRVNDVVQLVRQKVPYTHIAEQLGIAPTSVFNIARRHGLTGKGSNVPVQWTDEMRATLKGMFAADLSMRLIGERLGISMHAARNEAERLGLNRRGHKILRTDGKRVRRG